MVELCPHPTPLPATGFPGGSVVKNLLAMWETWVCSLGWEDPLEVGMGTHSSILVWRILMDRGVWCATMRSQSRTRLTD